MHYTIQNISHSYVVKCKQIRSVHLVDMEKLHKGFPEKKIVLLKASENKTTGKAYNRHFSKKKKKKSHIWIGRQFFFSKTVLLSVLYGN